MKPASLLGLIACASLVFVSAAASAAPGDAPKKKKPKSSVSTKGPKKVDAKADKADPAPEPVAPETKAADPKPAEAAPVPVGGTTAAASASTASSDRDRDRAAEARRRDEEDESKPFSAAPLFGYGTNHFGLAIGARAGYTLPAKVYVGATFMYHFGATYGYYGYGYGLASTHILYPAGEVGYDIRVGPVTIRPYAGVGIAFATASASYLGEDRSDTESSLLLYPGATAHWNIPRSSFFVGGDTRILILTRGGDPSFGLNATAGIKF